LKVTHTVVYNEEGLEELFKINVVKAIEVKDVFSNKEEKALKRIFKELVHKHCSTRTKEFFKSNKRKT
jgi:hypothetical protein